MHADVPPSLADALCQTLAWGIRSETRLARASVTPPPPCVPPIKMECDSAGEVEDEGGKGRGREEGQGREREGEHEGGWQRQSGGGGSSRSLATCIKATFDDLPAVVRNVHAENLVAWALEYLETPPAPRHVELRGALVRADAYT
jgi:hypothetical protein